jgi:hypothetical protein
MVRAVSVEGLVLVANLDPGNSIFKTDGSEPKTGTAKATMMAMITSGMGLLKLVRADITADLEKAR